jgi:hypothetical protein
MRYYLLALFCALCLLGCKSSDPVLASVGKKDLKLSDARFMNPVWDYLPDSSRLRFVEDWVSEVVLYEEAVAHGVDQDPATKRILDLSRRKIIVDRLEMNLLDTLKTPERKAAVLREFTAEAKNKRAVFTYPETFLRTGTIRNK